MTTQLNNQKFAKTRILNSISIFNAETESELENA